MQRQEAWTDLRNQRWSLFAFCPRTPVLRYISHYRLDELL